MPAQLSQPGDGQVLEGLGCRITIRLTAQATDQRLAAIEMEAPPGFAAPPMRHRHLDLDWQGYVVAGSVAMELDGKPVTIPEGGLVAVPRGVAFKWWNASATEPVRWICTYAPGGFEQYFVELLAAMSALGRPPTRDDLMTVVPPLWKKYNIEVVPG